ncbi:putative membrane protein [Paenibacillus methanolicus]|uniref:Putative membrane protein n=1 Tax=Paenibacillus methanolicus TaxID=582686 RepID=A0A5S5BWI9_9BACL|nr:putative membrane protein [Paenibacillus methanolicus]
MNWWDAQVSIYTLFPTISTTFIVISAVLVAIGWNLAIKRKLDAHKKVMIAGAVFATLFFIVYSSRTIFVGNTVWGGPDSLEPYYRVFLIFHIVLATVAAVFGISTLVLGFKERFAKHRKIGRVTSIMWFFTAITGVAVYVLLYVMYPGGHTKPMLDAIFGLS